MREAVKNGGRARSRDDAPRRGRHRVRRLSPLFGSLGLWGWFGILVLGVVAAADAGPFDPKQLSADTTWVVHVDVDALRTSTVVSRVYQKLADKWKDVDRPMAEVRSHLGIDPRKDLHSLTLSGPKLGDDQGVLIVQTEVDREILQRELAKHADYKATAYGPYQLESWTHAKANGRTRCVTSAFWKPTILVFGRLPADVKLGVGCA